LPNLSVEALGEVAEALQRGMARVGACDELAGAFLDHAGLFS